MVLMSKKVRPPKIDKELYKKFKKFCIDEDLETGKGLEQAIKEFTEEGEE